MNGTTIDTKMILETYRNAFAPALKAQQEGVRTLEQVGRYQYALAGDYLEWSFAQVKVALDAKTPAEFAPKQLELAQAFNSKLRARAQEFLAIAGDAQTSLAQVVSEATAKVASGAKKAA